MINYSKTNLYDLNKLCRQKDKEALKEWQRRWITPWPSLGGEIKVKEN